MNFWTNQVLKSLSTPIINYEGPFFTKTMYLHLALPYLVIVTLILGLINEILVTF